MAVAVALFTALAVAMVWILSLRLQGQLREQVLQRAETRSVQLADAMGGQMTAIFALVDRTALDMRALWLSDGTHFEVEARRALAALPPGLVSHMTVVDAEGYVVYNSMGLEGWGFEGDRPNFKALHAGADRLVLSAPVKARLTGEWLMVAGRALSRDGQFDGAVHLLLSTDYLTRKLGRLSVSDQDLVSLVHVDGHMLANTLHKETAMGKSVPKDRPFMQQPDAIEGSYRMKGALDDVPRIYGWRRLQESDSVLVVGLAQASVLAPLATSHRQALQLTGMLSLLLASVGGLIGWLLRRVERGQAVALRSEERLKAAQHMAHVGHWGFDIRERRLELSDEVFHIFGWNDNRPRPSQEAYVGLVHPDDVSFVDQAFKDAMHKRQQLDVVHRIRRASGEVRHVRLLCGTTYEGEEAVRFDGTVQDITELREAQLALEGLNTDLEQRVKGRTQELVELNRDLESFTYSVSHDLRTPLRSIQGFATLLQETEAEHLTEDGTSYLGRIQHSAQRMGVLITDLLSIAQHSRAQIHHCVVDLSELARSLVAEIERGDPQRHVQWHIEPGLQVMADPTLMRVVLQNLLGNAWKYTGQRPDAQISFTRCEAPEGTVMFCVRDNGAGFDMAYGHQLFQPFKRLHAHHQFEGSGIGLATVHRVVQRHGGSVRAEGAVGEGAAFYFSLPEVPQAPMPAVQENPGA